MVGPYPGSGLERGDYLGLVTLNLPAAATNSRFDGVDVLAVAGGDGGNRTIAGWVTVPRGTTTHLVARFELPASMAELLIEPSGRALSDDLVLRRRAVDRPRAPHPRALSVRGRSRADG